MAESMRHTYNTAAHTGAHDRHDGLVTVVAGSLFLPLGEAPEVTHADALLLSDVSAELGRVMAPGITITVPLASNHTSTTLIDRAAEIDPQQFAGLRDVLHALPSGDLNAGLAAYYGLGSAAWSVAAKGNGLAARVAADLLMPVWKRRNGNLRKVSFFYFSSAAGGSGGPTAGPAAGFAAALAHDHIGCVVTVNGFLIGALSFLGLGDRIFLNTAMATAEQLAYTLDPGRHAKESRGLVLAELPAADSSGREIDRNRDLRSALGMLLAGSWQAHGVQDKMLEISSNREFLHPYGALAVLKPSFFGLAGRESIGAAAARHYQAEWKAIGDGQAEAGEAADEITVDARLAQGASSPDPDTFIETARREGGSKPPLFDDELIATPALTARVLVGGKTIETVLPSTLDLGSLQHYRRHRRLLTALPPALERARSDARARATAARRHVSRVRAELLAAGNALFRLDLVSKVEAAVWGLGPHVRRFKRAFAAFHAVQRQIAEAAKAEAALNDALERVRRAGRSVDALDDRVRRTLDVLASSQTKGRETPVHGLRFHPLTDVYGELFEAVSRGNVSGLRSLLPGTAESMDLEGLAHLLGTDPRPETIANRLAGRPDFEGPFWGGADPPREPFLRFIVLPPLDAPALNDIRAAIERAGLPHAAVAADTLTGGASAVMLDVYDVEDLRSLFPQAYRSALLEIATTRRALYPMSARARALAATVLGTPLTGTES